MCVCVAVGREGAECASYLTEAGSAFILPVISSARPAGRRCAAAETESRPRGVAEAGRRRGRGAGRRWRTSEQEKRSKFLLLEWDFCSFSSCCWISPPVRADITCRPDDGAPLGTDRMMDTLTPQLLSRSPSRAADRALRAVIAHLF